MSIVHTPTQCVHTTQVWTRSVYSVLLSHQNHLVDRDQEMAGMSIIIHLTAIDVPVSTSLEDELNKDHLDLLRYWPIRPKLAIIDGVTLKCE